MSERKQYDDGLIRVGLLLANKRKSLGEPYQTREAFIDLRSVELFDGEPWISIRHLANIESGKNWISIEKLFALAMPAPIPIFLKKSCWRTKTDRGDNIRIEKRSTAHAALPPNYLMYTTFHAIFLRPK